MIIFGQTRPLRPLEEYGRVCESMETICEDLKDILTLLKNKTVQISLYNSFFVFNIHRKHLMDQIKLHGRKPCPRFPA